MFIHDFIKIMYTDMGYLPNYPYYLISDEEMFDAFLRDDQGFFNDYYPCPADNLQTEYETLRSYIVNRIQTFLELNSTGQTAELPKWIYSYMIMRPITFDSNEADIGYLYDISELDRPKGLAEFTPELANYCYQISTEWIKKLPSKYADRPPTMFGETHVTKSLRLLQANVLID